MSVGNQFYIGIGVQEITAPLEFQALANTVWLKGGPALYPNLLTNPSFEIPVIPSGETGNLLIDGSFEQGGLFWILLNGASIDSYQDIPNHNASAHTGRFYVILDHNTEEVYQEVNVTPGTAYVASLYIARETGAFASTGNLIVEGRNAGGTVVETYTLPLAPPSTSWTGGQASTILPGTAIQIPVTFVSSTITHARIRVVATNGSNTEGLLVDDVLFAAVGAVGTLGWGTHLYQPGNSANAVKSIDWCNTSAVWDGWYGVQINTTANSSNFVYIAVLPEPGTTGGLEFASGGYQLKPTPQMDLRVGVRVRMSAQASTSGTTFLEYRSHAGDGHENQFVTSGNQTIPNDGNWHFVYMDVSVVGDTTIAIVQVGFATSDWYDVDGWTARDAAANEGSDPVTGLVPPVSATALTPMVCGYLRGTEFEAVLDVANQAVINAGLTATVQASLSTYGRRDAIVKNEAITFLNPFAYAWVASWLNQFAVLLGRTRVKLSNEQVQTPNPGDASLIRVSGTSNDITDQYATKTSYTWNTQGLGVDIELTTQRPNLAKMLLSAALANAGSGVVSATGAALASSSSPPPTSTSGVSTLFGSSTATNLTGAVNGTNTVFVLTSTPTNGFAIRADGASWIDGTDFTYVAATLTITTTIAPNEWIVADIC